MKPMNVPLLDLHKEYASCKTGIDRGIKSCLKAQKWILGEPVKEFEQKSAAYLSTKHAVAVASGTDALLLALRALALQRFNQGFFQPSQEIITTPFTFAATAEAIILAGAKPVFADIDPASFNLDPTAVSRAVTENTIGIMPVHLFGMPADLDSLVGIAKKHGLFLVEDTAQAFGSKFNGKHCGTLGDCGAFSFFPSKNLGAFGDAGLITTPDDGLAEILLMLRNHGQKQAYDSNCVGYNSRLDSIQAAVLLEKIKKIKRLIERRVKIAQVYRKGLSTLGQISLPPPDKGHTYNLFTIRTEPGIRDRLLQQLNQNGVQSRVYYPLPLHKMAAFKNYGNQYLAESEKAGMSVLSLPCHPFLTKAQTDHVIKTIRRFFKKD